MVIESVGEVMLECMREFASTSPSSMVEGMSSPGAPAAPALRPYLVFGELGLVPLVAPSWGSGSNIGSVSPLSTGRVIAPGIPAAVAGPLLTTRCTVDRPL
jgi:hypothetical protein